jgi:hypothetical protein
VGEAVMGAFTAFSAEKMTEAHKKSADRAKTRAEIALVTETVREVVDETFKEVIDDGVRTFIGDVAEPETIA